MQDQNTKELRNIGSLQSKGDSSFFIHQTILDQVEPLMNPSIALCDVGCGSGKILSEIRHKYPEAKLHGMDLGKFFDAQQSKIEFIQGDLNSNFGEMTSQKFDLTISSEVIEHLENPRNFLRQLSAMTKVGGHIVLSTPNVNSFINILTFALKGHFSAFGPKDYPAHITPVSLYDLKNMIAEIKGIEFVRHGYVPRGRIPGTGLAWQQLLPFLSGNCFCDNYFVLIKKVNE